MPLGDLVRDLSHIGIRVHDLARSRAFYEHLGFEFAWGPMGPDNVAAMCHPSGVEINFIVNAPAASEPNILMDTGEKHAGFTHVVLRISDVAAVERELAALGIKSTGKRGAAALFIRDPDGNVIELAVD